MTEDSVVALHHPGVTADPLTEVLRAGARELLAQAIEAEVAAVLSVSRRPFCPVSRGGRGRWMRFCRRSTFVACPAGTSRRRWRRCSARTPLACRRDLSARRYVYMWADGIYLQGRLGDEKQCILVLIGATPEGRKELVGFQAGVRESAQSWRELLACLRGRGLTIGPELAIGDGALGFWKALEEIFPDTRRQRCWVHKTANVLNKLPKSRQTAAKAALHYIWMADGRAEAERAMNTFAAKYDAKYLQAVACLTKDRDALLAFYDFPAEHWRHIRTTNPIESVFATVRHRTVRTKGCLSHGTTLAMVFKLITTASKTWRRFMGNNQLPKVIEGVRFKDGMQIDETKTRAAA